MIQNISKDMPKEERSEIDCAKIFEPIVIEFKKDWWQERE